MDRAEPSVDELADSVIRTAAELRYRIVRDETGGLALTADGDTPVEPPLVFEMTEDELLDYYRQAAADAGDASTSWKTWLLLMSTHLQEALYQAEGLDRPCVIVIGETGFEPRPR
ncbi:hypothetical protein ACWDSJ_21040 [Nocardia sp. NPDC003482]